MTSSNDSGSAFNLDGFSTSAASEPSTVAGIAGGPRKTKRSSGNASLLIVLGLLGLSLFGGGVLWILTVAVGAADQVKLFGYGASMIGAICFVVSAYLLLRRLAGPDKAGE